MRPHLIILLMILVANAKCEQRVITFETEEREENFFEIQLEQVLNQSSDFSICLRCKFWSWNPKILFGNQNIVLEFATQSAILTHKDSTIAEYPTNGLKVSPSVWNSFCLIYDSKNASATLAINDVLTTSFGLKAIAGYISIERSLTVGVKSMFRGFSGQVTDFNVWNTALNETSVQAFAQCSEEHLTRVIPELVYWPTAKIVKMGNGAKYVSKARDRICQGQQNTTLLLFSKFNLLGPEKVTSQEICLRHNGEIWNGKLTNQELIFIEEFNQAIVYQCNGLLMTGTELGSMRSKGDQCSYYNVANKAEKKGKCLYENCFICALPIERSFFRLITNLSEYYEIDNDYSLINDDNGNLVYVGNDWQTVIKRMDSNYLLKNPFWNVTAKAYSSSFLLGTVEFATEGKDDIFLVKISNCRDDEFGCNNGTCIPIKQRCDGVADCSDKFDELRCQMVNGDEQLYQKSQPPLSTETHMTNVTIKFSFSMIGNFNEKDSKFDVRFTLKLEWYDWRLDYTNLKTEATHKNILNHEDKKKIWIPDLRFENAEKEIKVENDKFSSVQVLLKGNHTLDYNEDLQENEKYLGKDNLLIYSRSYKMIILCDFLLQNFPFDTQTCAIEMVLPEEQQGSVFLVALPKDLEFNISSDLPQFKVVKCEIVATKNHSQISVVLMLKRIFAYQVTNTFMPTSTLLVIAQATLHFDESKTELAVGLLLTVLLVMYTLYQSIIGSLQQTAYLKMIDYWLLFCVFMPFISFIIEVYWMLHSAKWKLGGAAKGWFTTENEGSIKRQKRLFLIFSHSLTLAFFVCYFLVALLMYQDVI